MAPTVAYPPTLEPIALFFRWATRESSTRRRFSSQGSSHIRSQAAAAPFLHLCGQGPVIGKRLPQRRFPQRRLNTVGECGNIHVIHAARLLGIRHGIGQSAPSASVFGSPRYTARTWSGSHRLGHRPWRRVFLTSRHHTVILIRSVWLAPQAALHHGGRVTIMPHGRHKLRRLEGVIRRRRCARPCRSAPQAASTPCAPVYAMTRA